MAFWGGKQDPTTQLLEVTVDRCYNLFDRGPIAREYSCVLTYGGSTRRTQPCFEFSSNNYFPMIVLTPPGLCKGQMPGYIRLTLQIPTSSCRRQDSYCTAPTLGSTAPLEPDATQPPMLYQLLPYDALPPPTPTQPNATGPSALWSQFLPYGSPPPPAATASAYNPTTSPPAGYPLPQYPAYPPTPPGPFSGIYPPPPR